MYVTTTQTYNNERSITERKEVVHQFQRENTITYTYDNNNNLIYEVSKRMLNGKEESLSTTSYTYNADNILLTSSRATKGSQFIDYSKYIHSADKKLTSVMESDNNRDFYLTLEQEYHTNGELKIRKVYISDGGFLPVKTSSLHREYYFDENGNNFRQKLTNLDGSFGFERNTTFECLTVSV